MKKVLLLLAVFFAAVNTKAKTIEEPFVAGHSFLRGELRNQLNDNQFKQAVRTLFIGVDQDKYWQSFAHYGFKEIHDAYAQMMGYALGLGRSANDQEALSAIDKFQFRAEGTEYWNKVETFFIKDAPDANGPLGTSVPNPLRMVRVVSLNGYDLFDATCGNVLKINNPNNQQQNNQDQFRDNNQQQNKVLQGPNGGINITITNTFPTGTGSAQCCGSTSNGGGMNPTVVMTQPTMPTNYMPYGTMMPNQGGYMPYQQPMIVQQRNGIGGYLLAGGLGFGLGYLTDRLLNNRYNPNHYYNPPRYNYWNTGWGNNWNNGWNTGGWNGGGVFQGPFPLNNSGNWNSGSLWNYNNTNYNNSGWNYGGGNDWNGGGNTGGNGGWNNNWNWGG